MTDIENQIHLEERSGKGRYWQAMPNGEKAELTFVKSGSDHMIVDHTWVPPLYRGRGVAERLVRRIVADARASGVKITPLCRFVAVEFRRHKEWADLLKA